MKQRIINSRRLTKNKWLNLFEIQYINSKDKICNWIFASRKKDPNKEKDKIDSVVIIPTIDTPEGRKLVITKEYRVPIDGFEYGFPAGLIENGQTIEEAVKKELKEETGLEVKEIVGKSNTIYSSPGMTDESCAVVLVVAEGEVSNKYQEEVEDIETFLYDINDIRKLLGSDKKVGAKAWGMLYYYSKIGEID